MQPYRVLLVDDEEDIRVGVSRKIPWEALGFQLVGEAENGREALELAELLQPDLVLTDIRMPFMDGLTLCDKLNEALPAGKFVILSGFDDFDYAKRAIRANVCEYILKPLNADELSQVLTRVKLQLDNDRIARRDQDLLRQRYLESLPMLREMFFAHWVEGRLTAEQWHDRASNLNLHVNGAGYMVAYVRLDVAGKSREMLGLSVRQLFADHFHLKGCTAHFFLYQDEVAILGCFDEQVLPYRFLDELERLCQLSKSYLDITLTIGIGAPCTLPTEVVFAAQGARGALDYRVMLGRGRCIYLPDVQPTGGTPIVWEPADEQALSNAIKLGTEEDLVQEVARLMAHTQQAAHSLQEGNLFFLELLTTLLKLTRTAGLSVPEVFGTDFTGTLNITDFASPDALEGWCLTRCRAMRTLLRKRHTDSSWNLVEKAKAFIVENYADSNLSIERICDHLHLSSAYFSTLFKKETGIAFTAFVTEVRMQKAAKLLTETVDKTYLIAGQVGYDDPNYFSYAFKKYFGVTPTKYRAQ